MESVESERREGTERHTEAARDRRREKIPNEKPAVSKGLFPKVGCCKERVIMKGASHKVKRHDYERRLTWDNEILTDA